MSEVKKLMTPIKSQSVVQTVIDKITDAIMTGELKPGDKLPTEAEMVSTFQVGRNTVREAIRVLCAYGVVEIRRPEGTFVCEGFSENMINPAIYQIILKKEDSYEDMIGFRQILENGIMQLLQDQGISDGEFSNIKGLCDDLIQKIYAPSPDIEAIAEADILFHNALAQATGNELVVHFHNLLVNLTRESRLRTIRHVYELHNEKYLAETHLNLLKTIQGKDQSALIKAINDSYFYWRESYHQNED